MGLVIGWSLVGLFVIAWPLCAISERRAWVRKVSPVPALPIDDGPLDFDGHTVPTVDELRTYAFAGELLDPVRERIA